MHCTITQDGKSEYKLASKDLIYVKNPDDLLEFAALQRLFLVLTIS